MLIHLSSKTQTTVCTHIPYKERVTLYAFTGVLQRFCKLQYNRKHFFSGPLEPFREYLHPQKFPAIRYVQHVCYSAHNANSFTHYHTHTTC